MESLDSAVSTLQSIQNTLGEVETHGDSTLYITDSRRALGNVISYLNTYIAELRNKDSETQKQTNKSNT